jgi:hypothetical protein
MDEKELAKQLSSYADAITAFAFVQGMAFALLIGQSKDLPVAVARLWYIAATIIVVMTGFYLWMVGRCHGAEDNLLGIPRKRSSKIASVVPMIRTARFWVIAAIGVADALLAICLHFFPSSPHHS